MKLEVGMYVRDKEYGIGKVDYICDCIPCLTRGYKEPVIKFKNYNEYVTSLEFEKGWLTKSSHNIIDLIQEGDYVNGYKVTKVNKDRFFTNEQDYYAGGWGNKIYGKDFKTDIKTIVTKEQFKNTEYEVKE